MTVSVAQQHELSFETVNDRLSTEQSFILGFRFWSPHLFDQRLRMKQEEIALSRVSAFQGDGLHRPLNITLYGLKYATTAYSAFFSVTRLQRLLYTYQPHEDMYLKATLYTATPYTVVLFGRVTSVITSPVQGSQYTVFQPRVQFAASDPLWYRTPPNVITATMTTGNSVTVYLVTNIAYPQQRWKTRIEVNVYGQSIVNPKVESMYDSDKWYQITDALSDLGDYWEVDHLKGTVVKYSAATSTFTNALDKFSGSFFAMGSAQDPSKPWEVSERLQITSDPIGGTDLLFTSTSWRVWAPA